MKKPEAKTKWKHKSGKIYEVVLIANEKLQNQSIQ